MRRLWSSCLSIALATACLILAADALSISTTEVDLFAPSVYAAEQHAAPQATPTYTFTVYLPLIVRSPTPPIPTPTATPTATPECPTSSINVYPTRTAYQFDADNPVRPAWNHADKNIHLRGYVANTDSGFKRELVNYGSDDGNRSPQLATMFSPVRVPVLRSFYRVYNWNWSPSNVGPGSRGEPITTWPVTALGLASTPGEILKTPESFYNIGPDDISVLVIYVDETSITFNYHQSDSAGAQGYTVHVDGICTDPNLRALYDQLDNAARNTYVGPSYTYPLPALRKNQAFGTAKSPETVVIIRDTGAFMDTRSCYEWWLVRPGYGGACPTP
jgi:hypothetical protein